MLPSRGSLLWRIYLPAWRMWNAMYHDQEPHPFFDDTNPIVFVLELVSGYILIAILWVFAIVGSIGLIIFVMGVACWDAAVEFAANPKDFCKSLYLAGGNRT